MLVDGDHFKTGLEKRCNLRMMTFAFRRKKKTEKRRMMNIVWKDDLCGRNDGSAVTDDHLTRILDFQIS
jgi:hypothetical protein